MAMPLESIVTKILSDQAARVHNKVDEPLSINIFNTTGQKEQSTNEINGQFVYSQLLIDCLLRMTSSPTDKDELIDLCKKQYKDNATELAIIQEFERDYSPDRALWWYTRESFLYRLLNKALRVQNIDLLFLYRFFIRDIRQQLEQLQHSSPFRVYRGQVMSNDELKSLKNSIGQFITMNSFLSTSFDRRLALSFLMSSTVSDDLQRVLFEMEIDPTIPGIKPCADITSHSFFTDEKEVLIMLGSIFRLNKIDCRDQVWIIQMGLCSDNDDQLKPIFDCMKKEYDEGHGQSSLFSFGILLFRMSQYDKAEKYYHRLLKELPNDHEDRANCYHNLGMIENHKGNYDSSLQWFNKALEMYTKTLKPNGPVVAVTHNSIGEVYLRQGNRKNALESFNRALIIRRQAFGEDNLQVAMCYHNMGNVYQEEKNFNEAFQCHQKALAIRQKHLPADHTDLGSSQNCIGSIYLCLGQLDLALQYYSMALKIYQKSLPADHPNVAMSHYNLGLIYDFKGNFKESLSNFQKASAIFHKTLPSTHPHIALVDQDIQRVSNKIR